MKNNIEQLRGNEARNLWMGKHISTCWEFCGLKPINSDILPTFHLRFRRFENLIKTIVKWNGPQMINYISLVMCITGSLTRKIISSARKEYENNPELTGEDEQTAAENGGDILNYTDAVRAGAFMDFDDLLLKHMNYLSAFRCLIKYQHPLQICGWSTRFQDTILQYSIVKRIADVYPEYCQWAMMPRVFMRSWRQHRQHPQFWKRFSEVQTFRLEQNYRSTKIIIKRPTYHLQKSVSSPKIWTENL